MSANPFAIACERARLSAEDGRVAFPRYRHEQLAQLYNALSSNREAIASAAQRDSGRTAAETTVELALALQHVKEHYDATQFSVLTLKEAVASKAGLLTRGKGLVVIAADAQSPLLSLIKPLTLAISAGNAAISILAEGFPQLNALLEQKLSVLDPLAFVFASPGTSSTSELLNSALAFSPKLVVSSDSGAARSVHSAQQHIDVLSVPATSSTSVIVDQGATDLARIAQLIVRGKFFGLGRLAGSVDHVLVHQKLAGELLELVLNETTRAYGSNAAQSNDYGRIHDRQEIDRLTAIVKRESQSGKGKVVLGGASTSEGVFSPTVIEDASSNILAQPVRGPVLPFITVGSLEGALAVQSRAGSKVLYIFASSERVRFLADESGAEATYDCDIPLEALIQPRSELYDPARFSTTRRVFSAVAPTTGALFAPFTAAKVAVIDKLFPRQKRLVPTRTMHSVPFLRAFFPQGLLLVGGSILLVILSSIGYGGFRGLWWAKTRYFS